MSRQTRNIGAHMKGPQITIRQAPEQAPEDLLAETLQAAGFWTTLESVRLAKVSCKHTFRIVIKPDLDVYDLNLQAGTSVALVEQLVRWLVDWGSDSVAVIDARNSQDNWLLNREPLVVADLAGYGYANVDYDIMGDPPVADVWRDADFRINFALNRTHEAYCYALCVHNLLGVSELQAGSMEAAESCLQVLRDAPPHFNIIDASVSCHGAAGERAPEFQRTSTFIACTSALLADVAGASKMGLDPYVSPINKRCFSVLGIPELYSVNGTLKPYPIWHNVHPLVADSARRRNAAAGIGELVEAWFQRVDREHFPFKEFYHDRLNSFIVPMMERLGKDAKSQSIIVAVNYLIAGIGNAVLTQYTLFDKHKLKRQCKPIVIDITRFDESMYTGLPEYLCSFERLLEDYPADRQQIRLRRLDDALLFSGSIDLPIRFTSFIRRVKIEHVIQYMNDYIGGSLEVVARDGRQRVRLQAERNLYLQQPNWMALFGGDIIDVEKLEFVEYKRDRRSIFWRTVSSPNGSAECDDGRVSFIRTDNGQTRVEIFTRQKFALPVLFNAFKIDLMPGIRDPIIERAYENYFMRTVNNLQAQFDGREFRAGRDPLVSGDNDGNGVRNIAHYFATALATIAELLRHRADFAGIEHWFNTHIPSTSVATSSLTDADGFRHFSPQRSGTRYDRGEMSKPRYFKELEGLLQDTPGFMSGLVQAVQRDFERFADTGKYEGPFDGVSSDTSGEQKT